MSDQYTIDTINEAIEARRKEVAAYEINIRNFEKIIARIPKEDPAQGDTHEAIMQRENQVFRRQLEDQLLKEKVQQNRSRMVLDALIEQLADLQPAAE
jgi:hypothetical protein